MIFAYQSSIWFTRWLQKQFMRKRGKRERERERERERGGGERVAFLLCALLSIYDLKLGKSIFCKIDMLFSIYSLTKVHFKMC